MTTMSPLPAIEMADAIAEALSPSTMTSARDPVIARVMSAMIAPGSSPRGLSDVTIAMSAADATAVPMCGRFPLSRPPPQPNTTMSRPFARGRTDPSSEASASGVCA